MIYSFGAFELDTDQRELRRDGNPVPLPPKPFEVLAYLIERSERLVSKSELMEAFWSADVSEAALQNTISIVRKAVGTFDGAPVIKTYHGRGFRFVASLSGSEVLASTETMARVQPGEQRLVTVLSVQFEPCAQDKDHDAGAARFMAAARVHVTAEQGRLMHMMINGFTAVFGLSAGGEDAPHRAIACAWALAMSGEREAELSVRCGVATGHAAVSDASGQDEWTAPGAIERDAVALSERAVAEAILLSEATCQYVGTGIKTVADGDAFRLCAAPATVLDHPARPMRRLGAFVGRGAELAFLRTSLTDALAGAGQAVVLSGPAGIGKSRLAHEFVQVVGDGCSVVTAQCLPRLADTPLAPIRQICSGLPYVQSDSVVEDGLDLALLRRLTEDNAPPAPELENMAEPVLRQRSRAVFVRLMTAACAQEPLLLVFEDVHWIDRTSRAHLDALVREIDRLPAFALATTRPVDDPPLAEAVLNLPPLGRQDSLALLDDIAGREDAITQSTDALLQRAAGNPFFLEELARVTVEGADPGTNLPATVQAVMEVRIAALVPELRSVLYAVAIIGPPAAHKLLAQLLNLSLKDLATDLRKLLRYGFLRDDADGVAFRHMLLNDAAYAMIAPEDRIRLHGTVARLMETDRAGARPELLALHLQEAGEADRAIGYWTKASNAALVRSDGRAAIAFAEKGLALLDPDRTDAVKQELGLQVSLATGLMTQRGYGAEAVGKAYYRADELAVQTGATKARMRTLLGLWVHTWVAGRLTESVQHGRALLGLAKQVGDPALQLQGHISVGAVLVHSGQLNVAMGHLQAALRLMDGVAPETITVQNAAVTGTAYAGWIAALRGDKVALGQYRARSESLCAAIDNPFAKAIHFALFASAYANALDADVSAELAERAIALSRRHGFPFWLGSGLVIRGWAMGQIGDVQDGLALVDEGLAVFEATEANVQLANWYGLKAETLLAGDDLDQGLMWAEKALNAADKTGDVWFTPRVHVAAATLCVRSGDQVAADAHTESAKALTQDWGLDAAFLELPAGQHGSR